MRSRRLAARAVDERHRTCSLYALDFLFNGGNRCWYALDKSPKRQARCRRRRRPRASSFPVTTRARQQAERTTRKELLLRARAHLFNDFPPFARRPVANLARCRCFHVLLAARGSFFSVILALGLSASASRSGACEPTNCHHSHATIVARQLMHARPRTSAAAGQLAAPFTAWTHRASNDADGLSDGTWHGSARGGLRAP